MSSHAVKLEGRVLITVPASTKIISSTNKSVRFLQIGKKDLQKGSIALGFSEARRFLTLHRPCYWWNVPKVTTTVTAFEKQTQLILWKLKKGGYGLFLPIIAGDLQASVRGQENGAVLEWNGALPGTLPAQAELAAVSTGSDPLALVRDTIREIQVKLGTFRVREEKQTPGFTDHFGWCTWDAFYMEVTEAKVEQGLKTFKKGGVVPGFCIVDAGWQDVDDKKSMINSFGTHPTRFPNGLKGLSQKAKEIGVQYFGVWHAIVGFWRGVNPEGELATRYKCTPSLIAPFPYENPNPMINFNMVNPSEIRRFYEEYYTILREQGVDMVKVDGQAGLEYFAKNHFGRISSMQHYQHAMQAQAAHLMGNNLIHCMCNSTDIYYNLLSSVAWRNSDDYFPQKDQAAQQQHIYNNSLNALFSSQVALPDWDMFQSHGIDAEYHAAARAISGGPVYVSDKPGKQNFTLLKKLVLSDSRIPKWDRPALPSAESLFLTREDNQPMKITNIRGQNGVIGLFHCRESGKKITSTFSPGEIPEIKGTSFAIRLGRSGKMVVAKKKDRVSLELNSGEHELATISPIEGGVAVFGLIDKFASAATLRYQNRPDEKTTVAMVEDGGLFGAWVAKKPSAVLVDGKKVKASYKGHLLSLRLPEGSPSLVTIRL